MIDLHTHTHASDGTASPAELVGEAVAIGLEALAVSDHDTLAGYDEAAPIAAAAGLDLVCGIEVSSKYHGKSVHLLGYFPTVAPAEEFRGWLKFNQDSRRDRNRRLVANLQSLGIDIHLDEVEAIGRSLAGRPHFARILVQKGYVKSYQEAFDEYLDESAKGYVDRDEAQLSEAVERVARAGGVPTLAHPIRITRDEAKLRELIEKMKPHGLGGIEVFHSNHGSQDAAHYCQLALEYDLAVTGGSDFHGEAKPKIRLGTGLNGNLHVPKSVLDALRAR